MTTEVETSTFDPWDDDTEAHSFAALAYERFKIALPRHLVPVTNPDVARAAFNAHPDVATWTVARRRRWAAVWSALTSRMDSDGVMTASHRTLAEQASTLLGESVSARLSSEVLSWAGSGLSVSAGLLFPVNRSGTGVHGEPAYVVPVPGTKESLSRRHIEQLQADAGARFQQVCAWLDQKERDGHLKPASPDYISEMLALAKQFEEDRRAAAKDRSLAQRRLTGVKRRQGQRSR